MVPSTTERWQQVAPIAALAVPDEPVLWPRDLWDELVLTAHRPPLAVHDQPAARVVPGAHGFTP